MEYGLYHWWPKEVRPDTAMDEGFDAMNHPQGLPLANKMNPMGKVFIKKGVEGQYIVIEFGEYRLRVSAENWISVKGEGYKIDDKVKVLSRDGKNTQRLGSIVSMLWHHKRKAIIHHLCENGRRLKKQYESGDIEKL